MPTLNIISQPNRGTVTVANQGEASAKFLWTDDGAGPGSTSFSYSITSNGKTGNVGVVNLEIAGLPVDISPELVAPLGIAGAFADTKTAPANDVVPLHQSSVEENDFILGVVAAQDAAGGLSCATPTGWDLIDDGTAGASGELFGAVFRDFAAGTEGSTTQAFNWNGPASANDVAMGLMFQFRNVDPTTPIDAAPTATAGTLTAIPFPTITTTVDNCLAVAVLVTSDNGTADPVLDGAETGGEWVYQARAGTTSGDDLNLYLFTAAMPTAGTISGGSVQPSTSSPVRALSVMFGFALRGGAAPPVGLFVSPIGDDTSGDGTFASPWQTLAKGLAEISAGETLWLRGGVYRVGSPGFNWSASGTSGNEISIASYPGEVARLTGAKPEFEEIGNSAWELYDAATETYRSLGFEYVDGSYSASYQVGGRNYRLLEYISLAALMSTTYTFDASGVFYRGAGIVRHTDGRIYIRMQNLSGDRGSGIPSGYEADHPLGDAKNTPPSAGGFDPRDFRIAMSGVGDLFTISGSHLKFHRIAFEDADRTVVLNSTTNVEFEHCRVHNSRVNIRLNQNNSFLTVRRCDLDTGLPPYVSWREGKNHGNVTPNLKFSFFTNDEGNNNITIEENLLRSAFDGLATTRLSNHTYKFLRNTCLFMFDDFVQFSGGTTNLEVGYNFICGGGPGYNGGASDTTASKWFHHNVIDIRRGEFGWRTGHDGDGTSWRLSHAAFPIHSTGGSQTPAKLYNNTILYRDNINNDGCRLERQGDKTEGEHEAYNNIAYGVDAHSYIRGAQFDASNRQILDYNIMFEENAYVVGMFREFGDGAGDYASLAAWKASAAFTTSQGWYAPGIEANSIEGDPLLMDLATGWPTQPGLADYRPSLGSPTSPAVSGAKDLSATGWPGATADPYFGAVDPAATRGLGAVGIPEGVTPGP